MDSRSDRLGHPCGAADRAHSADVDGRRPWPVPAPRYQIWKERFNRMMGGPTPRGSCVAGGNFELAQRQDVKLGETAMIDAGVTTIWARGATDGACVTVTVSTSQQHAGVTAIPCARVAPWPTVEQQHTRRATESCRQR